MCVFWGFRGGTAALAAVAALVLASCSSGPSTPQAATTTTHQGGAAATSTTATTSAPASTLPPVSAAGPLGVGAPIGLPFSADRVATAESPDGAVFAAPEDPSTARPAVAWVVDGNGPAAVAEHLASGIAALAADSANFYVATVTTVFAYDRASGSPVGRWSLPAGITTASATPEPVALTAAERLLFVSLTQGETVRVERIDPTSPSPPRLVATGLGAAVGPDGTVYYEGADFHLSLVRLDGTRMSGAQLAHTPTPLGGGVQYLDVVAGGALWVSEPAGQGLDSQFTTYDTSTLSGRRVLRRPRHQHGGGLGSRPAAARDGRRRTRVPAARGARSRLVRVPHRRCALSDPAGVGAAAHVARPRPRRASRPTPPRPVRPLFRAGREGV